MDFDVKCEYQMQNLKTQVLKHCDDDETSCVKEETHQCAKGVLCFMSFVTNQEWNPEFPWNVGKSTYTVLTSKDGMETVEMWISNARSKNTSFETLWWWRDILCVKEETHQCAKGVLGFMSFVTNQEWNPEFPWNVGKSTCPLQYEFAIEMANLDWPIYSRSLW